MILYFVHKYLITKKNFETKNVSLKEKQNINGCMGKISVYNTLGIKIYFQTIIISTKIVNQFRKEPVTTIRKTELKLLFFQNNS